LGLWMAVVGVGAVAAQGLATEVNIGINIGGPPPPPPPPMVIEEPPHLVVVPSSPVYYAPSVPYNFFYYDGRYWTFSAGNWFWGGSVRGPWSYVALGHVPRPVLAVPVRYYKVPPGHMKHHGGPPPWAGRGHGDDDDDDQGHHHGHGHHHGKD